MNRTFEEIVNTPILENDTLVSARIGDSNFDGKVVGLSNTGLIKIYIIECLDGTYPNKIYPYKFLSLPLTELEVKK